MKNFRLLFILALAYVTLSAKKCNDDEKDSDPVVQGAGYVATSGTTFNFTNVNVINPDPARIYEIICWGYTTDSVYVEAVVEFPKKPSAGSYPIKAGSLLDVNTGVYLNTHTKNFLTRTEQYFGNYGELIVVKKLADSSLTFSFNALTEMNLSSGTVKTGGKTLTGTLKEKI